MLLLELPNLLKLLGREALYPLGDLRDAQPFVVGGLKGAKDGRPKLGLARDLLGLPEDVLGLLRGFLGYPKALAGGLLGGPKTLPCYLLSGLQALLGGPLEGPHALPSVGEGREEVRVGTDPTLGKRPEAFLLPAYGTGEGLGGTGVVLGLLAQDLHGVSRPGPDELGVLLLELKDPYALGEELLGGPGVVLLELDELKPAFGQPHAPALGASEVLGQGLEGVALGLCHLVGRAGRLVYVVCGGFHRGTSVVVCKSLLLYSYHTYIRCQALRRSALPIATIHRSAWKGSSP